MEAILFAATTDADASRQFYESILGFSCAEDTPFALVFDAAGTMLRVQKVETVINVPYTTLGFAVDNLADTVAALTAKGALFEFSDFMPQDEMGIWTAPDGAAIAWCKDPDGNLVSFTQHPRS